MIRFSSGWGLFLICLASLLHVHPLAGQTKRALVVAIGDYRDGRTWKHISSVEDLVYIRAGLGKFGFTTDHIDTLKNEQATKAAILNALDKLASTSGAGDHIVFYFCGHGQQIMDNNGMPDEDDGYDEALVTYNAAGMYNPTGDTGQNHLRDDELGQKLSLISKQVGKAGSLLVMIDACHSGSATRTENFQIARGSDKPFKSSEYTPSTLLRLATGEYAQGFSDKDVALDNMVVISASGPHQLNKQTKDEKGENIGSLSYAFARTCSELSPGDDYYLFFEKIKSRIQADHPTQVPILEGDGRREIFSGNFTKAGDIIAIGNPNWINDSSFYFDRGYLNDLTIGSTFTITALGSKDALAVGYIARVEALQSIGVARKSLDKKQGYQLHMNEVQAGDYSATIYLNKHGGNATRTTALEKQLKNFISPYSYLSVGHPADFMIDIAGGIQDTLTLVDKLDQERTRIILPAKKNISDQDWKEIIKSIQAGIRISYIRNIPDGGSLSQGITAKVVPQSKSVDTATGELYFNNEDEFSLQIINNGNRTVFFNLIDIMPDGNIKVLVPYDERPPADCQLRAGSEYMTPLLYVTPEMPRGKEVFRFFLSDQPIDLRPMIQRLSKNKERANMQSIEKVFTDMFEEDDGKGKKKRDMSKVEIDKTGVVSAGYTIK